MPHQRSYPVAIAIKFPGTLFLQGFNTSRSQKRCDLIQVLFKYPGFRFFQGCPGISVNTTQTFAFLKVTYKIIFEKRCAYYFISYLNHFIDYYTKVQKKTLRWAPIRRIPFVKKGKCSVRLHPLFKALLVSIS